MSATKISRDQLLAIIDVQTAIVRLGQDLAAVIALVADRSMQLARCDGAVIELAEGEDMVYRAVSGIAANQLGLRVRRATSLSGMCLSTCQIQVCHDAGTDDRVDRVACRKVGLRSMLVVPLLHGGVPTGVLKLVSREPGTFGEAERELLELLSEAVGAAMFHAAKYESGELFYRATHDVLTGLGNRALFLDRLRKALEHAERSRGTVGLLMLDMDDLKKVNDELGHAAGDAALKETAIRIKAATRDSDTVARLGGDEFAAILVSPTDAHSLEVGIERVTHQVNGYFQFHDKYILLGVSVGGSLYPHNATDMTALMNHADQAMYARKRLRKSLSIR